VAAWPERAYQSLVARDRDAGTVSSICKEHAMLWTLALVLVVLWALGLVTAHTMGGFIHILIALAVIVVLIRIIQGRKVL
jgi:hypothetical protein